MFNLMIRHAFLRGFLVILMALFGASFVHAGEKIEALISHVQGMADAKFIRNGKEYEAKDAAKFLRGKWKSKKGEIHSLEDFIEKVATKSSTTGKAYLIRLKGAKEVPCATYLRERLSKQ